MNANIRMSAPVSSITRASVPIETNVYVTRDVTRGTRILTVPTNHHHLFILSALFVSERNKIDTLCHSLTVTKNNVMVSDYNINQRLFIKWVINLSACREPIDTNVIGLGTTESYFHKHHVQKR